MSPPVSRRDAVRQLGALGAGALLARRLRLPGGDPLRIAGHAVEVAVCPVSAATVRITITAADTQPPATVPATGELARETFGPDAARSADAAALGRVRAGDLEVSVTDGPPVIVVRDGRGDEVQRLTFDPESPAMGFSLGDGPIFGLGEGGPQFDRRGSADPMISGQAGYQLATHGTRAPVQWLIGTKGWGLFIHQPYGALDCTGARGVFMPHEGQPVAADLFVVGAREPAALMREYARLTGLAEFPARWTLGYQQSHRTLAGRADVMGVARTMRDKRLPCDALIYLGTEFTPSGWNTRNGEFTWHPQNFPDPAAMLEELHAEHFKVILHVVIEGERLTGTVADPCTAPPLPSGRTPDDRWPPDRQVSCYWPAHRPAMAIGVDGWWPDQGDDYDGPSRLARHRMYWEGMQRDRPNERPYALHRNASAGAQRYGGFIWSGDVRSRWETLRTHVAVGINSGLSGLPYWGTDIGGFIPTEEFTAELFVRWFQFAAFCPLFRAHGRNWHLRLPWGWNGGDGGPPETRGFAVDPADLHNAGVEPICRRYLELRQRLMPYLYTAVRETHDTGLPVMRALWLHHPDDPAAVARGDEYLWGRDLLVAPVTGKGATRRSLYLPRGTWYDFWTERPIAGGREIEREVDLATTPVYVRAGAVLPVGPVRQYTEEPVDEPVALVVFPGADGESPLYDDDGHTFAHRDGVFLRLTMRWRDAHRRLTIARTAESGGYGLPRRFLVRVAGESRTTAVSFDGPTIAVRVPA